MPTKVNAEDLSEGDRVLLAGCMEFEVAKNEVITIDDKVYGRGLVQHRITLNDGLSLKSQYSDEGRMAITKDPTDQIDVLVDDEVAPQAFWKVD